MLTYRLFIQQLAYTNKSTKTAKLWKLLVSEPLSDFSTIVLVIALDADVVQPSRYPDTSSRHVTSFDTHTEFQFKCPVPSNICGTTEIQIYMQ